MQGTLLKGVSSEELAGIYTEVAEEIGIDNAYVLFKHFRGQQLTFPLKFYSSDYIAQRICQEHGKGESARKLATKYGYSESRVRQILAQSKQGNLDKSQGCKNSGIF